MNDIKNELMKKKALLEEYKKRRREKELQKINNDQAKTNFENLNAEEILLRCGLSQPNFPTPSTSSVSLVSYSSSANSLNNLPNSSKSKNRPNLQIDQEVIKKMEKMNLKQEIDQNTRVDILPVEKIHYAKETQTQLSLYDESSQHTDEDHDNTGQTPKHKVKKKKPKPAPLEFYEDVLVYDTFQWEDEFTPLNEINAPGDQKLHSPMHETKSKFYLGNKNQDSTNSDEEDLHDAETTKAHCQSKASNGIDFDEFLSFMVQKRPIVERALKQNEPSIFFDYTCSIGDINKDQNENIIKIELKKTFNMPDKLTSSSIVTCLDWSAQHPEWLLGAYDNMSFNYEDSDSEAIVGLWNVKSDQKIPLQSFTSTSLVTSCKFSQYSPSLIIGSTYSGQIVMWDIRSNKRTPIQRSSLSITSHVNPVYCIQVLDNQLIVSISNDGKVCTWSLENLNIPIDSVDLMLKQPANRQVYATCLDFQTECQVEEGGNVHKMAVVGAEDGLCHSITTNKFGLDKTFEGHFGPITSVNCFTQCLPDHNSLPLSINQELSQLFLSSSFDSTIKLWNSSDNKCPVFTFESHGDYVYDVGWSPIHPALFAAADGSGRLDFWNLNRETETPSASIDIDNRTRAINKLKWSRKGTEIAIGDDHGELRIYEISENFARPDSNEYDKLLITLDNLKKLNQESINFNLNSNYDSNYINYLIESFK